MRRPIIVDANLIVLLAVGLADITYISKHKRCRIFNLSDFYLLVDILSEASEIILTPHALAEASNLSMQIAEPAMGNVLRALKLVAEGKTEVHVTIDKASSEPIYDRLVLTDAALVSVARNGAVILTVDYDLFAAAYSAGCEAWNFTHLMEASRV